MFLSIRVRRLGGSSKVLCGYVSGTSCTCPVFVSHSLHILACIGIRSNIHLGSQTKFFPNGEHKLFVTRPRQGEKTNNELLQYLFFDDHRVVPDERLLYYPTRTLSQVDGYLFCSVTQLVKQMCCLLPE